MQGSSNIPTNNSLRVDLRCRIISRTSSTHQCSPTIACNLTSWAIHSNPITCTCSPILSNPEAEAGHPKASSSHRSLTCSSYHASVRWGSPKPSSRKRRCWLRSISSVGMVSATPRQKSRSLWMRTFITRTCGLFSSRHLRDWRILLRVSARCRLRRARTTRLLNSGVSCVSARSGCSGGSWRRFRSIFVVCMIWTRRQCWRVILFVCIVWYWRVGRRWRQVFRRCRMGVMRRAGSVWCEVSCLFIRLIIIIKLFLTTIIK